MPLFVLDGVKLKEGEARVFKIFEPRYKLMIKECLDKGRPLLVVGATDDVGSLCRVGDATHDVDWRLRRRPPLRTNCQGRRAAGVARRVRPRARGPRRLHEPVPRPVEP